MKFFEQLRLLGIYHDKPDDGGGGGGGSPSLEEMTNTKIHGSPDGGDGDGGGEGNDPPPKSGGDDGGGKEDPPAKPKQKEDPPSKGDDGGDGESGDGDGGTPEPEGGEGEEDGDGDGSDMFYDPDVHVEGKPAHSNVFPTRDKAEFAAIQKAEMLRNKLSEMEEDGVDRGAVRLPSALKGDPDNLDNMTNLEIVTAMDDGELRNFLNESDGSRQRLDAKHNRVKQSRQAEKFENDLEEAQGKLFDDLRNVMDIDEIQENLRKFNDPDKGRELIQSKIDQKVEAELSDDIDELENWIDKVDEGEIDLSFKEFDKQKQKKVEAIEQKEQELREQYGEAVDTYERVFELQENVEQNSDLTPEQKDKKRWNAFDTMQHDLGEIPREETGSPDLDILADNEDARAELIAAKNWAVQNAEDYNDLLHPADWREALEEGWPKFKEKVRAGKQRKELDDDDDGGGGDDIPKPGDQRKLDGDGSNIRQKNKSRLDKLEELTNAKVGT